MNPEAAAILNHISSAVAIAAAVIGLIASVMGTLVGTKLGQKWLEKSQEHLHGWVGDLDKQVTEHERRISTVEGICEERGKRGGAC